jgi:hypothetical protein
MAMRHTAHCRNFVLSLTMHAKQRVVVRRVVAVSLGSNRRLVLKAKRQGDIAPHDNAPFGVLR